MCVRSRVISIARLLPSAPLFNFPCLLGNLAYGRSFPPPDRSTCFFCLLERAAVPYLPDGLDLFLSFLPAEGEEASFPPVRLLRIFVSICSSFIHLVRKHTKMVFIRKFSTATTKYQTGPFTASRPGYVRTVRNTMFFCRVHEESYVISYAVRIPL